jgi:serine/threonine-protein kinase
VRERDGEGHLLTDTVLSDKYKIIKLIHTGKISRIYNGLDCNNKKNVFIKEITQYTDPSLRQQAIEQFKCEAKILFKLKHKSLPKFVDYFDYRQRRYLVLEYIEGKKLTAFVENNKDFIQEKQVITWGIELCDVLLYLHNMKPDPIIFRNMNPESIMVSSDGTLKLIDFGTSKIYEEDKKTLGIAKSITPHYSPIEQHIESTDKRSDIYSLGATMYYLITGETPMDSIDRSIDDEPMEPCRQINPDISKELERIIMKAMEIDREYRYQDVEHMKSDLIALSEETEKSSGENKRSLRFMEKSNFESKARVNTHQPVRPFFMTRKPVTSPRPAISVEKIFKKMDNFQEALPGYITPDQKVEEADWKSDNSQGNLVRPVTTPARRTLFKRHNPDESLIEYVQERDTSGNMSEQEKKKSYGKWEKSRDFYIDIAGDKQKEQPFKNLLKSFPEKKRQEVYKVPCEDRVIDYTKLSESNIAKRYKILTLLYCGNKTRIYKCLDRETDRELIIKELFIEDSLPAVYRKEVIKQLRNVVELFLTFNHSNLPKFLDYIESEGNRYVAMEFIDGTNLEEIIVKKPELPKENQLIKWAVQLCDVLGYLHGIKPDPVILRNLKPDNIFLDRKGNIKILGFGLCKIVNPDKNTSSIIKMANLHYSPPEQYSGLTDTLTDIYSLGATLYYLATKVHPIDSIELTVGTAGLIEPFIYNQSISNRFSAIINRAMNLKKADRYQSIAEIERDLRLL